jgi:hypothetical protein
MRTTTTGLSLSPWVTLPLRTILFMAFQSIFALVFLLRGSIDLWTSGAAWWPFAVIGTNGITILVLIRYFKSQGTRYRDLFRIQKEQVKQDIGSMILILLILLPVAFLPNIISAQLLFGDQLTAVGMLFQPLPLWAILVSMVIFPITQGLAEIPLYMSCCMPELDKRIRAPFFALLLPVFFLGAQHIAVPLIFDSRFIIWRLVMYMPFALLVGIVIRLKPRLLPYLVVLHVLMDISASIMYFVI